MKAREATKKAVTIYMGVAKHTFTGQVRVDGTVTVTFTRGLGVRTGTTVDATVDAVFDAESDAVLREPLTIREESEAEALLIEEAFRGVEPEDPREEEYARADYERDRAKDRALEDA